MRQAAMAAAETVFHQAQEKMGSLKDDLSRAEAEMAQLKGLFNIRRRREQAEVVDSTRANVEAQQKILDELEHDYKSWNEGKGAV